MKTRCQWAEADPLSKIYHDTEWGVPQHDDRILFEHLILDGLQAGLSWSIILKKREYLRSAFDNFDPLVIASYGAAKIDQLLTDKGVIRNRAKLEAVVQNAHAFQNIRDKYKRFDDYIWQFVNGRSIQNGWKKHKRIDCHEHRSEKKRFQVRWSGNLLCIHAGRWDGK
jgi:DNA-3-methyladenine glycosylase I